MDYKYYNIKIVLQVVLLAVTTLTFILIFYNARLVVTKACLIAVWFLQIFLLLKYTNNYNKHVMEFLNTFQHDDYTIKFNYNAKNNRSAKIHRQFNVILESFQQLKLQGEKDRQLYENAIRKVNAGIFAFDESGRIIFSNDACERLLNLNSFNRLEQLEKVKEGMQRFIAQMKPGETKHLRINHRLSGNPSSRITKYLSIYSSIVLVDTFKYCLINIHNIKNEVEQSEIEGWKKLINIMRHEIMNSMSPINLLSSGLIEMYEENRDNYTKKPLKVDDLDDTLIALKAIKKRSQGLISFVESYRQLSIISKPDLKELDIESMFSHIIQLHKDILHSKEIDVLYQVEEKEIKLIADEKLVIQVLINLLINAIDAYNNKKGPNIILNAFTEKDRTLICVEDNGTGIDQNIYDEIFTPFFTTKETGTGLGLNFAQQVMKLHKGSIHVDSTEVGNTVFTLEFLVTKE